MTSPLKGEAHCERGEGRSERGREKEKKSKKRGRKIHIAVCQYGLNPLAICPSAEQSPLHCKILLLMSPLPAPPRLSRGQDRCIHPKPISPRFMEGMWNTGWLETRGDNKVGNTELLSPEECVSQADQLTFWLFSSLRVALILLVQPSINPCLSLNAFSLVGHVSYQFPFIFSSLYSRLSLFPFSVSLSPMEVRERHNGISLYCWHTHIIRSRHTATRQGSVFYSKTSDTNGQPPLTPVGSYCIIPVFAGGGGLHLKGWSLGKLTDVLVRAR